MVGPVGGRRGATKNVRTSTKLYCRQQAPPMRRNLNDGATRTLAVPTVVDTRVDSTKLRYSHESNMLGSTMPSREPVKRRTSRIDAPYTYIADLLVLCCIVVTARREGRPWVTNPLIFGWYPAMDVDGSNVHLGLVPPGSEAGTPPPGDLVEQLRGGVSTLRAHIETAKMNRVEPYAYLKATLVAIAHCHPGLQLDQLLLWAFNSASR